MRLEDVMASPGSVVFVGLRGAVVAVDRDSGKSIWESNLKGSDFVTVTLQDGDLFAASRGRVYRLDPASGAILWVNELAGLGWGIVSIAGASQTAGPAETRRRQAAAASTTAAAS
jgi:outer membrane protein assembly factor BamB